MRLLSSSQFINDIIKSFIYLIFLLFLIEHPLPYSACLLRYLNLESFIQIATNIAEDYKPIYVFVARVDKFYYTNKRVFNNQNKIYCTRILSCSKKCVMKYSQYSLESILLFELMKASIKQTNDYIMKMLRKRP